MPAQRRSWTTTGVLKSAANSIATATANTVGTDYPQVGDLVYVIVACDNTSATAPQHSGTGPVISGGGATGVWTKKQRTSGMSGTAAASTQLIVMYATVTTAFTASTVFTVSLSSSPNAKVIGAFAFYTCNTPTDEFGPIQGQTVTASSAVAGGFNLAVCGASSNTIGISGSTQILSVGTTGGSAATNVGLRVFCDASPTSASVSSSIIDVGYGATISAVATAFPWADAYLWDGSSMIAGDLYEWDGSTLQPLDVFGVV